MGHLFSDTKPIFEMLIVDKPPTFSSDVGSQSPSFVTWQTKKTHRIHGTGILTYTFTYIYHRFVPHVGIYSQKWILWEGNILPWRLQVNSTARSQHVATRRWRHVSLHLGDTKFVHSCCFQASFAPWKFNIAPEKWMVGRLASYCEGNFLGAMFNFQGVYHFGSTPQARMPAGHLNEGFFVKDFPTKKCNFCPGGDWHPGWEGRSIASF